MNGKSSTMMTRPTGTSAVSSLKFSCCNNTDVIVKMLLNVCPTKSLEDVCLLYCEIGRAAGRERVEISVDDGSL